MDNVIQCFLGEIIATHLGNTFYIPGFAQASDCLEKSFKIKFALKST